MGLFLFGILSREYGEYCCSYVFSRVANRVFLKHIEGLKQLDDDIISKERVGEKLNACFNNLQLLILKIFTEA